MYENFFVVILHNEPPVIDVIHFIAPLLLV